MKKQVTYGLVLASITLGLTGFTTLVVQAADPNAESTGTVSFNTNSQPTAPIDTPTAPTDPTDPNTNPDQPTNNTSALRIDIAPNFHFGSVTLGTGVKTQSNTRTTSNLQVTDSRGTLTGWHVSVSRTAFVNQSSTLESAKLVLNPSNVFQADATGTKTAVTLAGNPTQNVEVGTTATTIFAANANEGGGTYQENFDGDAATLELNSNQALVGTYTSTLTWTIDGTPATGAQ